MRFEWDPSKRLRNRIEHGIRFDSAITAFDDPCAWIAVDEKRSTVEEVREWLTGECDDGVVGMVFTRRPSTGVVRLISARRASRRERSRYEERRAVSL